MSKKKATVWKYDDLWEDGYRFDCIVSARYCFVSREFAKNKNQAAEFLRSAYRFIKKIEGTSKPIKSAEILSGSLVVVIME